MSAEQAKAFILKMQEEDEFYDKIVQSKTRIEEAKKLIEKEGFDCTVEEIEMELEKQGGFYDINGNYLGDDFKTLDWRPDYEFD